MDCLIDGGSAGSRPDKAITAAGCNGSIRFLVLHRN
jgi:hypothetical protein